MAFRLLSHTLYIVYHIVAEGNTMNEERTLFTTAEVAAQLGLSHVAIRDAIRRGRLGVIRINPRLNMISAEEIDRYRHEVLGKRGGYHPRRD